jgi:hypothetical protein
MKILTFFALAILIYPNSILAAGSGSGYYDAHGNEVIEQEVSGDSEMQTELPTVKPFTFKNAKITSITQCVNSAKLLKVSEGRKRYTLLLAEKKFPKQYKKIRKNMILSGYSGKGGKAYFCIHSVLPLRTESSTLIDTLYIAPTPINQ